MKALEIRLFGGLEIIWDGYPLPHISSVTARSFLSYLITYRSHSHTRDLLAGTFWSEYSETEARRRLSQALWQIRRTFAPHHILKLDGDAIQFAPDLPTSIDLEELNHHYGSLSAGSPQDLEHAEACLEIYRGEFLTGYYEEWILIERERLRNLYLETLGHLVNGCKRQSQFERALAHAHLLVGLDPWNEGTHREIMRLYHLLGRNAEAIQQYQIIRQAINYELGVEPSPETSALAAEIVKQGHLTTPPWLPDSSHSNQAPLLERPDRLPLVGRKSELSMILDQVDSAAKGEGGLSLLVGAPGIGKTRLLRELAQNVEWRGLRTAWGRCYELSGPLAYQPLIEVFRSELQILNESRLEPLWRAELGRLLPELSTGVIPTPLKPEEEQNRLLEAIVRGFQTLTNASPYVIILEDAHWMDPASLAAIRYLLPRLPTMSMLVLISLRGMELSRSQAEAFTALENTRIPRRLELEPLNLEETGRLVQLSLDLDQAPAHFSARLYAETEGNPFFLTETLRNLLEEGLLYQDETGAWSTQWDESAQGYAEMPLPKGVAQSIHRRLDSLSKSAREALDLASVIGRGISFDLWRQAGNLSEGELLAAGKELCDRGLLIQGDTGFISPGALVDDYLFAHDQIRRVTYDSLAPPNLRTNHSRVAEALVVLFPEMVESLAYHWTVAGVWDKAALYHQESGDKAAAIYANTEAIDHYTQALQVLERIPGTPDLPRRFYIRLALEKVYDLQGDRKAQTQEQSILSEMALAMNDDCRRAEVALRQARLAGRISEYPSAISAASRAVDLARQAGELTVQAESRWEWGWALLIQGDFENAKSQFEQAILLARETGNRRLEADNLHGLGTISLATCEYSEAKSYYQQVIEISQQIDIRQRAGRSLSNLGYIATAQGEHDASKAYNQEALRIYQEIGDQRGVSIVFQNLADEFLAEGDFAQAKSYLEEALKVQTTIKALDNLAVTLRSLGLLFHQLGEYTQAKGYYQQAYDLSITSGIRLYQGQTLAFLSLLNHHLGDDGTAQEQSEKGLNIAIESCDRLAQGWLLDSLGYALLSQGKLDQAENAFQRALTLRREINEIHKTAESLAGLAQLALIQNRNRDAMEFVEEILYQEKTIGLAGTNQPFQIHLTCFQVLAASQDPRAEEILANAYQQLMAQKFNINNEALERSFLENVAAHHEILLAYLEMLTRQAGERIQVKLPRIDAPGGRPLREDEYISVTWTISAPEDQSIPGKAERRQCRLIRLLEEARSQGASPTHDHLAEALGVTRRTVERDLDHLRLNHPDLLVSR